MGLLGDLTWNDSKPLWIRLLKLKMAMKYTEDLGGGFVYFGYVSEIENFFSSGFVLSLFHTIFFLKKSKNNIFEKSFPSHGNVQNKVSL